MTDISTGGDSAVGSDVEDDTVAHDVVEDGALVGWTFWGVFECFHDADGTAAESAFDVEVGEEYDLGSNFDVDDSGGGHATEKTGEVLGRGPAAVASVVPEGCGIESDEMVVVDPKDVVIPGDQLDDGRIRGQRATELLELFDYGRADFTQPNILEELEKVCKTASD